MSSSPKNPNLITEGPIGRGLLTYFFPIFIGSLFQQLYNTVDAVIVGKYIGKEALAAVGGSAGQIAGIIFWLLGGIASGATVTVSQHYGAKDYEGVHRDIHNGILLAIIGSVLFTLLGLSACRPLFAAMKTPEELMEDSLVYIRILFIGLTVTFLFNMGSGILRALGDSRRPLWYLLICCLTNVFLDLLFVLCFNWGISGAALATVLAQAVSAYLVLRRLMKLDPRYRLRIRKLKIYPRIMKVQLAIGLPGGFQSALYGIANIIIQTAINLLGTDSVAAYTAFGRIDSFFWLVDGAFGAAVTTYVGQNYGAGSLSRVRKSTRFALLAGCLAAFFLTAVFLIFEQPLLGLFTSDAEVLTIGGRILRTMAPFYFLYIFIEVLSGALRGLGNVAIPTVITLVFICAVRILWVNYVFPKNPVMETLITVFPVSWVLTAALFILYYLLFFRKLSRKQNS